MKIKYKIILSMGIVIFSTALVFAKEFSSSREATELIELYTSEGCSSCPPADQWLRQLTSSNGLFKKFIPLSFHVDYWNQLGWTDRFSSAQFSNRQYQHHKEGNISQVYTPGIIVNNQEWRNWRIRNLAHLPDSQKQTGVLTVNYNQVQQQMDVSFTPEIEIKSSQLYINVAFLGMGLSNDVQLGENSGRKLMHDFVVLTHNQHQVSMLNAKIQTWQIEMPPIPERGQKQAALVVWLSTVLSQDVIQATGGYL